jgi:tRNA-specific 2-thiouridylase
MQRVIVGLSGGVDSSVTAALLKQQGYEVIGVFMKNWSEDLGDYGCTWAEDSEDARRAARHLKIPFYVWNFEREYRDKVVDYFFREYQANRTPNPDVMCNTEIKFKIFLDKALSLGADFVATGHYAQVKREEGGGGREELQLLKGIDPAKDQSYFLYTLNQNQLSRILFPLGGYYKSEVRALARQFGLPNAEKKDSQGICFIGPINVREFLKTQLRATAGKVVTAAGETVGRHEGLPYYTIGQRQGFQAGGRGPYYVIGKDLPGNRLVVTNDRKDPALWQREFTLTQVTWTNQAPALPLKTGVSIRYHHPEYSALITAVDSDKLSISFDSPQRAITPGQAAVIYRDKELLGGGVIESVK